MSFNAQKPCFLNVSYYFTDTPRSFFDFGLKTELDLYSSVALLGNKDIIMSSFKSSRDIQKKEGGQDSCFG